MEEKVSVVVPVFNRAGLLVRCLDSVAAQTWGRLEIIVVDNGSADGSADVAEAWAEANKGIEVLVLSEPRRGACAARNKGLDNVSGEYVIFFDSDDVMRPGLVRRAIKEFQCDQRRGIVCWPCCIHGLDGSLRIPPFQPDRPLECHMIHALLRPQGYMARTNLVKDVGGWNESLPGWNDWELGVRLLLADPEIGFVEDVLSDIYAQPESITGRNFSSKAGVWEKSLDAVRDVIKVSLKGGEEKRRLLRIVAYRTVILAAHYAKEGRMDLANRLKRKAMSDSVLGIVQRLALQVAYAYTGSGGRGAWLILRHIM